MTDDYTDLIPRFWNDVCQGTLSEEAMRSISKNGCNAYAGPHLAVTYSGCKEMMFKWGDECIVPYLVDECGFELPVFDSINYTYGQWCANVVQLAVETLCTTWVEGTDYEDNDFDLPEPSELTEWLDYDSDC